MRRRPAIGVALSHLGHTFGHALEAWTGYSDRLLHGEGVAIGMCLAFRLSEELGICPPGRAERVTNHLRAVGLPTKIGDIPGGQADPAELFRLMGQDKKVKAGKLAFILVHDIGQAFVSRDVQPETVLGIPRPGNRSLTILSGRNRSMLDCCLS